MMFVDVFQLGYTISHSLWHLGGAALAFQDKKLVNWCPELGTVLANEDEP